MHDTPQEVIDTALRRSTRIKKSAIPSDYIAYLQESDYNIGAADAPETFSQAMNGENSTLWYNAMKTVWNLWLKVKFRISFLYHIGLLLFMKMGF